jgi:hypothetical protein
MIDGMSITEARSKRKKQGKAVPFWNEYSPLIVVQTGFNML